MPGYVAAYRGPTFLGEDALASPSMGQRRGRVLIRAEGLRREVGALLCSAISITSQGARDVGRPSGPRTACVL